MEANRLSFELTAQGLRISLDFHLPELFWLILAVITMQEPGFTLDYLCPGTSLWQWLDKAR